MPSYSHSSPHPARRSPARLLPVPTPPPNASLAHTRAFASPAVQRRLHGPMGLQRDAPPAAAATRCRQLSGEGGRDGRPRSRADLALAWHGRVE
eukprot:scaffold56046_cov43-Phaeocystis_antarctica.AAC.3